MKRNSKSSASLITKIAAFSIFGLLMATVVVFTIMHFSRKDSLPVLGEPGHVAGRFSFVNQDGQRITEQMVKGKVTVVEYFFTSCPSICPVMSQHLKEVYNQFKDQPAFMILSHTVDPERDSVPVMRAYAKKYTAQTPGWQFLTGSKDSLYACAIRDYLLAAADSASAEFIHTQYVTLLDGHRRIRGFYDMTNQENTGKMEEDIAALLKENDN